MPLETSFLCLYLVLAAIILMAFSGIPACIISAKSSIGQLIATGLMIIGGITGLAGLLIFFSSSAPVHFSIPFFLPLGSGAIRLDSLSAVFLALIFFLTPLSSIFGLGYWNQVSHQGNGQKLGLVTGFLGAAMALLVVSSDALLFLMAWEGMALSAFFASTVENELPAVRRAGWIYLIATHIGTLFLFAMFLLWAKTTGSFLLIPFGSIPEETASILFTLSLVGFGLKAGIMPFHIWLPGAHANAPSHVSALMSGVMLKMGVYGILRMTSLLQVVSPWWGIVLLIAGAFSGILGIIYAMGQKDIKRLLAYSSVENIGIITMGIGLALLGRFYGRDDWVLLGIGGAILHAWNHGLFKPLLFLSTGCLVHVTNTRHMDQLGGLHRKLPAVSFLFLIACLGICALPPLNGFASEWILYGGFFNIFDAGSFSSLSGLGGASVALAFIGALAVACFVKLYATVFLGLPRQTLPDETKKVSFAMIFPMLILAGACLLTGLMPFIVLPAIDQAIHCWSSTVLTPLASLKTISMLPWISVIFLALILASLISYGLLQGFIRKNRSKRCSTWNCGYELPNTRMQYTGSSLVSSIVELSTPILQPSLTLPQITSSFPQTARFRIKIPDVFFAYGVLPVSRLLRHHIPKIRIFQQGQTQRYILYLLLVTLFLFFFIVLGVHL